MRMTGTAEPNEMQCALLVAYGYPPIGTPGSLRISKFSTYLPEFGWRPVVLSVQDGFNPRAPLPVPQEPYLRIERVNEVDPLKALAKLWRRRGRGTGSGSDLGLKAARAYRGIAFPDRDWLWLPAAVRGGRRLLKGGGSEIRVVFSSSPGITNHVVAMLLSKRFGIPWVAEFRDMWALSRMKIQRGKLRSSLESRLETRIMSQADALVTVMDEHRERLTAAYGLPLSKMEVVYNGYDPEDFRHILRRDKFDMFTLAHAGNLYEGKRSPLPLFQALKSLSEEGVVDLKKVQMEFFGPEDSRLREAVRKMGLLDVLRWRGYIPYAEVLQRLADAYLLVLITQEAEPVVTSKLFDYMGTGRPVVALGRGGGTLERIMSSAGLGEVYEHGDVSGLKMGLATHWQRWKRGDTSTIDPTGEVLLPFTRRRQAAQLARIFDRVQR